MDNVCPHTGIIFSHIKGEVLTSKLEHLLKKSITKDHIYDAFCTIVQNRYVQRQKVEYGSVNKEMAAYEWRFLFGRLRCSGLGNDNIATQTMYCKPLSYKGKNFVL